MRYGWIGSRHCFAKHVAAIQAKNGTDLQAACRVDGGREERNGADSDETNDGQREQDRVLHMGAAFSFSPS